MKIYIINLKQSKDRKLHIQNEIKKLNNKFDIILFEAIDAKSNQHLPYKQKHFSNLTKYLYARNLTETEIACFTSHYLLWQKCLELNEPIIILEDDIIINNNFTEAINNIATSEHIYVRLIATFNNFDTKQNIKHNHFAQSNNGVCGSQGYYLTPTAASNFIKNANKWHKPVDDYMDSFWINGVPIIIYVPYLIADNPDINTSTIERKKEKKPLHLKLVREISNLLLSIRKYLYITKYEYKNKR